MDRKLIHIVSAAFLVSSITSCYVTEINIKKEDTTFVQKASSRKVKANPDEYRYSKYQDKVSGKLIKEVVTANGNTWRVTEKYDTEVHDYLAQKHSLPKLVNRRNKEILYGLYYKIQPDYKRLNDSVRNANDGRNGRVVRDVVTYMPNPMLNYWFEFDSTGHFIKSVYSIASDSPVVYPHLYFGSYEMNNDTLELLIFGRKRIAAYSKNRTYYRVSLIQPQLEKYLMSPTKDTLMSVTHKAYIAVKTKDTLENLPVNKDLLRK